LRPYQKEIRKPLGILLQPLDFSNEFFVFRHTFLNVLYDAVSIDQECYPSFAVQISDRLVSIGNKRKGYTVFLGKFFMGLNRVITYTQNLGVQVFKAFDIFLEGLQLPFSDR
jgi:hypothetical protein